MEKMTGYGINFTHNVFHSGVNNGENDRLWNFITGVYHNDKNNGYSGGELGAQK